MASGAKRKTTFAKLAREQRVRERRLEKKAKKDARKRAAETRRRAPSSSRGRSAAITPCDSATTNRRTSRSQTISQSAS